MADRKDIKPNDYLYEFGEFRLDVSKRLLWRNGGTVPLMPKAFDVLLTLVQNQGQVVTKDDLMTRVWHDTIVEENSLNVNISALRKIFGEKPSEHRFIVTVPGIGYEFVAGVREVWNEAVLSVPSAVADGLTLATEFSTKTTNANLQPPATAGGSDLLPQAQSFKRPVLFIIGAVLVLIVTGFGLSRWWNSSAVKQENDTPFQTMQLTKLTTGKALQVGISPDGKQVGYVLEEPEGQSLWLRQTAIDSSVRLVPPQQTSYLNVVFGRDGDFIYFVTTEPNKFSHTLYEIPVLGGSPRKLLEKLGSPVALSHDGRRFSFLRWETEKGETNLFVANTDGTGERQVATTLDPERWWIKMPPAWSPDDSRIACLLLSKGNIVGKFVAVRLSDGGTEDLTTHEWKLSNGAQWTSDGLIVSAQQRDEDLFQLWHINTENGAPRKLTSDLHGHDSVSLTADSKTLATIEDFTVENIWLVELSEPRAAKQITSGVGTYHDISVTPDGKFLFSTRTSSGADIWQMDLDGSNRRQLTRNAGSNYGPTASPDGRYLFFHSNRDKTYFIYRTRADGSEPQRLTDESIEEATAASSPDGKKVVFVNYTPSSFPLKRVSVEGGNPVLLNDKFNFSPVVSPDGKFVAVSHSEKLGSSLHLALFSLEKGGEPLKTFPLAPTSGKTLIRWMPDGRALLYIDTLDGVSNIWRQPIDGSAPTQFTDFKTERIFSFDVLPDGKTLACVRGIAAQDVVLLTDKEN